MVLRAALLCGAAIAAAGQTAPDLKPRFDTASVKPDPSLAVRHVLIPPSSGRLSTRMAPLGLLIQNAYQIESFQINGGPEWMNSAGFDIEAKAEGNPGKSQMWVMLQTLLEERFQLKAHRETKVMRVYDLTAAKGGPKLAEAGEAECVESRPANGQRPLGPCGYATLAFDTSAGLSVEGRHVVMADLVRVLSAMLQRPVADHTGYTKAFDVNIPFAYDPDVTIGIGNPWRQTEAGHAAADLSGSLPIMDALPHDIGLKLEAGKGPVEVLVIDHAERPSEN